MSQSTLIQQRIQASIDAKQAILDNPALLAQIGQFADLLTATFQQDGKVLFCGNGGSAGDAQHIAAELSGRFYKNRPPLYAEALHVNSSYLTAVANDFGYDEVYARMVQAAGRTGDVLVAISTSGNSPNILKAVEQARAAGMKVVGMTGDSGGKMRDLCDILINIPSSDTPRIQESHILVGHIICELVEAALFE
jgi:D-sedoheptulose 7-phosphate isomerase